jgi:hypothetical protein
VWCSLLSSQGKGVIKKMKAKLMGLLGAGALSAVMTVGSFAQTPAYVMDTTLQDSITSLLSSFVAGAFIIIGVAITTVGAYWVSIRLVHVLLGWFHKFAH